MLRMRGMRAINLCTGDDLDAHVAAWTICAPRARGRSDHRAVIVADERVESGDIGAAYVESRYHLSTYVVRHACSHAVAAVRVWRLDT